MFVFVAMSHLFLELLHRFFGKLCPGLGLLQLGGQGLDLLFVADLPLVGLLLGHLQGLEVVGHHPQLLLQLDDLDLPNLSSFLCPLQIGLSLSEFLLNFVVLLVCVLCLVPGRLQLLLEMLNVIFFIQQTYSLV